MKKSTLQKITATRNQLIADVIPASWNHLKKQFVALVTDKGFLFISEKSSFSRSGCNASLSVDSSTLSIGDYIVVKDGSHRHMTMSYYKIVSDIECQKLLETEDGEVIFIANKEVLAEVEKEMEKEKKAYALSLKRERVMKLAHQIKKEFPEAVWGVCLQLAWRYYSELFNRGCSSIEEVFKKITKKEEMVSIISSIINTNYKYWNRKLYSGNRIFIDDVCYHLTDEQVSSIKVYCK